MNLLQQFTHIHSVTVSSSQGRDGGAPVPACSRPTVKAFVLPDSPSCYVYWSSLCLPCSTGISFCVHACAEAPRVFILVAVFFWSFRFAKRVFRKNPFSPQGELRLISTCWESMRHLAVKLKPKNSREVISFYRSNFTHNVKNFMTLSQKEHEIQYTCSDLQFQLLAIDPPLAEQCKILTMALWHDRFCKKWPPFSKKLHPLQFSLAYNAFFSLLFKPRHFFLYCMYRVLCRSVKSMRSRVSRSRSISWL